MFGLSFGEICVLVIVAIVVIGPKDMPVVLRKAGQLAGRIRRGEYDAPGPAAAVAAYARRSVVAKLRVANPRYLERFARS